MIKTNLRIDADSHILSTYSPNSVELPLDRELFLRTEDYKNFTIRNIYVNIPEWKEGKREFIILVEDDLTSIPTDELTLRGTLESAPRVNHYYNYKSVKGLEKSHWQVVMDLMAYYQCWEGSCILPDLSYHLNVSKLFRDS